MNIQRMLIHFGRSFCGCIVLTKSYYIILIGNILTAWENDEEALCTKSRTLLISLKYIVSNKFSIQILLFIAYSTQKVFRRCRH